MWPGWKWVGTRADPEGKEEENPIIFISEIAWPDAVAPPQNTRESMRVLSRFGHVWLCDPMDCSQPGFSVHRILQARILEWVAMLAFGGSSHPRIEPTSPAAPVLQADSLPLSHWEATGKPLVGQVFMFIETTCRSCSPGSSSLGPLWGQSLPFWPAQVMLMHHNRQSKPQYCKI